MDSENRFNNGLAALGITFSDRQREQFDRYYELLTEWNKVMNLTGITDYEEVQLKHFTDSLSIARIKDMNTVNSMIDIGTGAGFPGIPIKIVYPHIRIVLLDSLNKRLKLGRKTTQKKQNTGNSLICVFPVLLQICLRSVSTASHL